MLWGWPLFLFPWGSQVRAWRSMLDAGFLRVCPIQPHFLRSIYMATGSCPTRSHWSFRIFSYHWILRFIETLVKDGGSRDAGLEHDMLKRLKLKLNWKNSSSVVSAVPKQCMYILHKTVWTILTVHCRSGKEHFIYVFGSCECHSKLHIELTCLWDRYHRKTLFFVAVSINWATDGKCQTNLLDTWKAARMNFPRQETVNSFLTITGKIPVLTETLVYVSGSCACYSELTEEMSILLRLTPREDSSSLTYL